MEKSINTIPYKWSYNFGEIFIEMTSRVILFWDSAVNFDFDIMIHIICGISSTLKSYVSGLNSFSIYQFAFVRFDVMHIVSRTETR